MPNQNTISCPTCKQTVINATGKYPNGVRACPVCKTVKGVTVDIDVVGWTTDRKGDFRIDIGAQCPKCDTHWTETISFIPGTYKAVCIGGC